MYYVYSVHGLMLGQWNDRAPAEYAFKSWANASFLFKGADIIKRK